VGGEDGQFVMSRSGSRGFRASKEIDASREHKPHSQDIFITPVAGGAEVKSLTNFIVS
jgi:hypothetical protein